MRSFTTATTFAVGLSVALAVSPGGRGPAVADETGAAAKGAAKPATPERAAAKSAAAKSADPREAGRRSLLNGQGKQFDPHLVRLLLEYLDELGAQVDADAEVGITFKAV